MNLESFKDLKVGDQVAFENIYIHDKLTVSGQGKIYGFGRFDHTDLVWVDTRETGGEFWAIPYEKIIRL